MGQLSGAWQQVMHPVSLWPGSMVWVILTLVAVVGPVQCNDDDDKTKNVMRVVSSERGVTRKTPARYQCTP